VSSYATTDDLAKVGLPSGALSGVDPTAQLAALNAASAEADGYLASHFTLPLVAPFPADLVTHVCGIAAFRILSVRGFNPEAGSDVAVRMRFDDAMKWLRDISNNRAHPQVTDSSSGSVDGRPPRVISASKRGW